MDDGVHMFYCERSGCGRLIGAQKVENGQVVEEEFEPGVVKEDDTHYYCNEECQQKKDDFVDPEEGADVHE